MHKYYTSYFLTRIFTFLEELFGQRDFETILKLKLKKKKN